MQFLDKKRLESAQEQRKRDCNTKVCRTPKFKPDQMVDIDKSLLAASFRRQRQETSSNPSQHLVAQSIGAVLYCKSSTEHSN